MGFVRHGSGARAAIAALTSQVHPVFMLPPLAASWFGGILTGDFSLGLATLHMTAIFLAVYTAHVKDGLVDFHVRGEDDDHPLTATGCRLVLVASSAGFFATLGGLWWAVGVGAVVLTLPTWLIGYHHAPQLDMNPVTATTGYPAGIALAILGGYYVQAVTLAAAPVAFGLVFLLLLSGVKVIDDAQDVAYDRSIAKRTVAVAMGPAGARRVAFGLLVGGMLSVVGFALADVFPSGSVAAVLAFAPVAVVARRTTDEVATMLLIRGSYVFLAVLIAAVWFRPLG